VDDALEDCDALVLPTLPIVAPLLGDVDVTITTDPLERMTVRSAMLRHTQLFNLTGHPAISLPIQTTGWPVGLQLVGQLNQTARLLAVASEIEKIVSSAD
jgi:Asp-tRNA(Asn)/Glu-tRNA(Gln) amidotransferase A subunit family amidase